MSALKKAATAIKEGYEAFLKGHKDVSISHKSSDEGLSVDVSIKGSPVVMDNVYKALTANTHNVLQAVQPANTVIHQARMDIVEGTGEDKDKKHITIHHLVTTY